ncbi:leucine-rich repeat domain-containing protein [Gymnodinialimonas sp. 57CJ19]|uniref:leucine-rich repeat domain-containing protein n=1 Tax=Gymnodinialimonas sp. 57CJ19 TaxID=3138498 RepID=UPI00313429D9
MPLRLPSPVLPRFILPAVAAAALVACQPDAPDFTVNGQEALDTCVAQACETLMLDGLGLRDYSQINGLSHVTSLMVSYTDFSDLSAIADMAQLRELHMASAQVRDLSGLAALPNLELLHVQFNEPTSHAPIAGLSGLRELAVGGPDFNDLSFAANMHGLERLLITSSAPDLDLSTLGANRGLRTVEMHGADTLELAPLLALPNLRQVSLSYNGQAFGPAQTQAVLQLRARGVIVDVEEILPPVC